MVILRVKYIFIIINYIGIFRNKKMYLFYNKNFFCICFLLNEKYYIIKKLFYFYWNFVEIKLFILINVSL